MFIQLRKKKVGANKYRSIRVTIHRTGNKSKKKLKNNVSAIKKIEPGNPKNTNKLIRQIKNSFGHIKLIPLTSVINRVLKRRLMASTSRNELVDKSAWLISIQKLASISADCPLTTQIVNQCISTTVE